MKDREPAFPCGNTPSEADGMSLRDYFAAAALMGEMANADAENYWQSEYADKCAMRCYHFADAMLAERERTP